jgi:CRISPR-associated protein Csm1
MNDFLIAAQSAALQVIQQAVSVLAEWAALPLADPISGSAAAIDRTQEILSLSGKKQDWLDRRLDALQVVFDHVKLSDRENQTHYRPARAIQVEPGQKNPKIPYAQIEPPTEADLEELKRKIRDAWRGLDRQNLTQLTLFLEKFGSHLSFGEPDVALVDLARSSAAIAAALAQQPPDEKLSLVAGDLTGVQKFIYTISSEGALKSLRARSFYLELATEEIVYQLLTALNLPRTNIIYAGASKFYLLAAASEQTEQQVQRIQAEFNVWLREKFQGKVFLAIGLKEFPASDLAAQTPILEGKTSLFSQHWQAVNHKLTVQASRKFEQQLDVILKPRPSYEPCKVCHRDDVPTLNLKRLKTLEGDSVLACNTCCEMFELGGKILTAKALLRSSNSESSDFSIMSSHYNVLPKWEGDKLLQDEAVFLINNWTIKDYNSDNVIPLLLGNYGHKSLNGFGFMTAGEKAERAEGISRVGYLRMDVDRLSQIFSKGLGQLQTLPRLASLSRQMTYFFKVHLCSLAEDRFKNLPSNFQKLSDSDRKHLLFIYAGGDDLFVSGSWNEVVEFAFDVYQSFRAYTGHHPDITLSAGIEIAGAKFPLYQAADRAGELEDAAKDNGRDSLALFGEVLTWAEWLGDRSAVLKTLSKSPQFQDEPEWLGVFPFVQALLQQNLEVNASRAFVRNLLSTAQQQDQLIEQRQRQIREIQQNRSPDKPLIDRLKQDQQDIRYFLHLPKIAYALTRLPKHIRDRPEFQPVRRSLKHPRNAPYFKAIATWIEFLNR